jgi:hypothetical protein
VDTQVSEYEDYIRSSKLSHWRFHRMSRQIASMFLPVLLLCALILAYSLVSVKHEVGTIKGHFGIAVACGSLPLCTRNWLDWHDCCLCVLQDSTLRKFTGSLTNGLTVLAAIFLITAVFIVLYAMEWKKVSAEL